MMVVTTFIKAEQEAAYNSLRKGVMDYDRRHGYRGAESYLDMKDIKSDQDEAIDEALQDIADAGDLIPALVLAAALGGQAMVVRTGVAHRSRWSAVGAIGVAMWAGVLAWYWLPRLHLGAIGPAERVYREAGRWVAGNLPADAVVSSFATSGALY